MRRLLIRPGALGDCIVSMPALEALRAGPAVTYTEVWTAAAHVPLMRFADQAHAISSTGLDLLELGQAPAALHDRLRSFDSIVSWYGASRVEFREAMRGLPVHFFPALPTDGALPASEFYARQAESLGARVPSRVPCLTIPRIPSMPYAVLHPFSGSPRKNWPLDRFLELAARLSLPYVFTAGPEEELPAGVPDRRFQDLWELAQWLGNATLYIGNDSGPTHLAAAAGTRVVAIFGPSDDRVWAPPGARIVRATGSASSPSPGSSLGPSTWPSVDEVLSACVELPGCTEENSFSPRSAEG